MFFDSLFRMIENFKTRMIESAWNAESSMVPFGVFGSIVFPLFYFINLYTLEPPIPVGQLKGNIPIRVLCTSLCLILALKNHWPTILRPYLPFVWHTTILFAMPFFAAYMTLECHFSAAWALSCFSISILCLLLVDWFAYVFLLILGTSLAILSYYCVTPQAFPFTVNRQPLTLLDMFYTYTLSIIIIGIICSRRKSLVEYSKLQAVKSVGASIAHELRTPLASIEAGITGAKIYFPTLLNSYAIAKEIQPRLDTIPADHFATLLTLLDELEEETKYSNTIIDMLLIKSKQRDFSNANLSICSMNHCIEEALRRYPFKENELQLIHWDNGQGFNFKGEFLLILHVFFNLMKNALYFIEQEGKGTIKIGYESSFQYNLVHFRDTAKGIPIHVMPKLFEKFYSYSNKGTGLGLAFCKMVMRSLEGDIKCHSVYGEFTDFILYFPKTIKN